MGRQPALIEPPQEVRAACERLAAAGHQVYLVGGCVRDTLLNRSPRDWDVATDARPGRVLDLFPEARPTGIAFGTVTLPAAGREGLPGLEITTFRSDLEYRDAHRPSRVAFADRIETDLARRDFTINALAYDPLRGELVDPWDGLADLERGLIRAVGDPRARLHEDPLRSLRAVRLVAELGFRIEACTREAARVLAGRLPLLSGERIRDELLRLLAGPHAVEALREAAELGLLFQVIPELSRTREFPQGKAGASTLIEHLFRTVGACPPDPVLRLAALLHDAAKPQTARRLGPDERLVFHGHDVEGARVADQVCRRLRLDRRRREVVTGLVRWHMVAGEDVGKKAIRRWIAQAPRLEGEESGEPWVRRLIALRRADHVASGHGPDNPFADRLERELVEVVEEASALTVRDLAIDGRRVMEILGLDPGPEVGRALRWLLDQVLEDPSRNAPEALDRLLRQFPRAGPEAGGS